MLRSGLCWFRLPYPNQRLWVGTALNIFVQTFHFRRVRALFDHHGVEQDVSKEDRDLALVKEAFIVINCY